MADDYETRQKRIKTLQGLFSKTKENGCSEEEAASAADMAASLMSKWAIDDSDLGIFQEKVTFVRRELNVKYANKWRYDTANTIAHNTGVVAIHFPSDKDKDERIIFYGREQLAEAAALVAEFIISTVEQLSAEYGKESGTGMTGKRRFARGCSMRLRDKIRNAYNVAADPRFPVIMGTMREEALLDFGPTRKKKSSNKENMTPEFLAGWNRGESVPIRVPSSRIAS